MIHRTEKLFIRDTHPELPLDPDVVRLGEYKWPPHFSVSLQATVFIGGCFGTLARYGVTSKLPITVNSWPTGTLLVNLTGALLLGILLEALTRKGEERGILRIMRLGVGTGFIGAFTTYSTLTVEISLLANDGHAGSAITYAIVNLFGGLLFSIVGIQIAAGWHRARRKG